MAADVRIVVHYPLRTGALKLRADDDWERDVEPDAVDGSRFEFVLSVTEDDTGAESADQLDPRRLRRVVGLLALALAAVEGAVDGFEHLGG